MSVGSPGSESFSPYPGSEVDSPAPSSSPLLTQNRPPMIARQSTPRTASPARAAESGRSDGDDKLKNFFQSLLVNKGK